MTIKVWMIVHPSPSCGVIYGRPATTASKAWEDVIENRLMGTGVTRETLIAQGWRAKRVWIVLP